MLRARRGSQCRLPTSRENRSNLRRRDCCLAPLNMRPITSTVFSLLTAGVLPPKFLSVVSLSVWQQEKSRESLRSSTRKSAKVLGENQPRRDLMKVAQYEVLGNNTKRGVRPARDDRNARLFVSHATR